MSKSHKIASLIVFLLTYSFFLWGHPMPNSVVNFSFGDNEIHLKVEVPISEFESAIKKDLLNNKDKILTEYKVDISQYFLEHVKIKSTEGRLQSMVITDLRLHKTAYNFGEYLELIVELTCKTSGNFNNRAFIFDYDAVIHQVVTHFALIKVHQDFENGITPEDSLIVSTIHLDIASNSVKPLSIKLEKGSKWKGLMKMVKLGMLHIYTGLDHLLFILTLIIISPLLLQGKKWAHFGGWKYTLKRLLKIITSFTVGHCITLFIFSLFNLNVFSEIIEITITLTIIITAYHTIKPLFYDKEIIITFLFGLIHGSAFGITLNEWGISNSQRLLSLLGFNIGIELMQLILVLCCLPLIYLSKYRFYNYLRIGIACLTIFIATFWLIERVTDKPNGVSKFVERVIK